VVGLAASVAVMIFGTFLLTDKDEYIVSHVQAVLGGPFAFRCAAARNSSARMESHHVFACL
jgi:hypothetical protein